MENIDDDVDEKIKKEEDIEMDKLDLCLCARFFNSFGISTHLSRLERNIGTHGHDSNGTRYDSHQLWNINHAGWKSRQSFS